MNEIIIDVQSIVPAERHGLIFQKFDHLEKGQSLIIVNDHDPRPLLRQFQETRPNQFQDEYLQAGPEVWKVKITRTKSEGCCGFCGGEE